MNEKLLVVSKSFSDVYKQFLKNVKEPENDFVKDDTAKNCNETYNSSDNSLKSFNLIDGDGELVNDYTTKVEDIVQEDSLQKSETSIRPFLETPIKLQTITEKGSNKFNSIESHVAVQQSLEKSPILELIVSEDSDTSIESCEEDDCESSITKNKIIDVLSNNISIDDVTKDTCENLLGQDSCINDSVFRLRKDYSNKTMTSATNLSACLDACSAMRLQAFTDTLNNRKLFGTISVKKSRDLLKDGSPKKKLSNIIERNTKSNDVIVISDLSDDEESVREQGDSVQCLSEMLPEIQVSLNFSKDIDKISSNNESKFRKQNNTVIINKVSSLLKNSQLTIQHKGNSFRDKQHAATICLESENNRVKSLDTRKSLSLSKIIIKQPELIDLSKDSSEAIKKVQQKKNSPKPEKKPTPKRSKKRRKVEVDSSDSCQSSDDIYNHICVDDLFNFDQSLDTMENKNISINDTICFPNRSILNNVNNRKDDIHNDVSVNVSRDSKNVENDNLIKDNGITTSSYNSDNILSKSTENSSKKTKRMNENNKDSSYWFSDITSGEDNSQQSSNEIVKTVELNSISLNISLNESNDSEVVNNSELNYQGQNIDSNSSKVEDDSDVLFQNFVWNTWKMELDKQRKRKRNRCDCAAAYDVAKSKDTQNTKRIENYNITYSCCMFRNTILGPAYYMPKSYKKKNPKLK